MTEKKQKKNKAAKTTRNKRHIEKNNTLKKGYQAKASIANKLMRCSVYNMMN